MDKFFELRTIVIDLLKVILDEQGLENALPFSAVTVERPKSSGHGELSTNAAIVAAKSLGQNPAWLAGELAARLRLDSRLQEVTIAGPGFINLRLRPEVWMSIARSAVGAGPEFGRSNIGAGRRIHLEFVSANPTGPLHVGHVRGAVYGDSLGRLLEFTGHDVVREYYVNDGGAQVDALARSAYLRYLEANGSAVEFGDGEYVGEYLISVGIGLKERFGDELIGKNEAEWLEPVRTYAISAMMDLIRKDLDLLGIGMDIFFSERSLQETGRIEEALAELDRRGLIYEGVLDPPKGSLPDDWEPRRQTLLRATAHGDDVDRPVRKSDGSWTYFASDIAYHYDKIKRGYDELVNIFGADHGGYTKRLKAVVSALSDGGMPFDIKLTQLVRVITNEGASRMSKRAGQFVSLREAVEAVGPDVTRFVMLMRKNDAQLEFNFEEVRRQSKENPVFYVQYAHARICSVLERARSAGFRVDDSDLLDCNWSLLAHPDLVALARRVAEWPRTVDQASRHHEPHRIAFYLNELASDFHSLWSKGNSDSELKLLDETQPDASTARIGLARSAGIVISSGLGILGVTPISEMRN